jgi:membrane-associated protease RseP (regulator of RpoE activity)
VLPSGGEDVFIHPVALAGWAGLLVTGLNLVPAGQLDGGHVAYVLFGKRARALTWAIIGALIAMGAFLWDGWFLWAGLVFLFGQTHAVPFDDVTPLRPWQRALAIGMLVLFALVFTPVPMVFK